MDLNSVKIDGSTVRNIAIAWAVDTGRKDMNAMASGSESAAKGMYGVDGTAIADGRKVGGNDV